MKKQLFTILIFILLLTTVCNAHPGRTDKYGGHTNKATGEYHFHNSDGSITVGTKPEVSVSKSETTVNKNNSTESLAANNSKNSEPNTPQISVEEPSEGQEPNDLEETENPSLSQEDTIVVDNVEKSLQDEVIETLAAEHSKSEINITENKSEKNNSQLTKEVEETKEILITTDKNGDNFIYIPSKTAFSNLSYVSLILLSLFAFLGLCVFSTFMCLIFKKVEKSNSIWQTILHVPYLIFWLPSLLGNLIFKLYYRVIPSDELDSLNADEEDDDYEI